MEGPLSKWTNVVKGWQYRWFVLDDNTGLLSYYTVSKIFIHAKVRLFGNLKYIIWREFPRLLRKFQGEFCWVLNMQWIRYYRNMKPVLQFDVKSIILTAENTKRAKTLFKTLFIVNCLKLKKDMIRA